MSIYTYRPIACIRCGTVFTPISSLNRWCSDFCHLIGSCDRSGGDDACWNWTKGTRHGYGFLNCMDEKYPVYAHRKMYKIIHQVNLPSKTVIRHTCDNRLCINPLHLLEGTQADNIQDMMDRGRNRQLRGGDHHNAGISDELAQSVFDADGKAEDIAERLSVPLDTVWKIRAGNGWKHISKGQKRLRCSNRKLTDEQIIEIFNSKDTGASLARKYFSHTSTISLIRNGKLYAHLTANQLK